MYPQIYKTLNSNYSTQKKKKYLFNSWYPPQDSIFSIIKHFLKKSPNRIIPSSTYLWNKSYISIRTWSSQMVIIFDIQNKKKTQKKLFAIKNLISSQLIFCIPYICDIKTYIYIKYYIFVGFINFIGTVWYYFLIWNFSKCPCLF